MHKSRLLCTTAICGALSWCVSEKSARAADLAISNPPSPYVLPQLPAVGAFNGEIGAFGGGFNQGGVGIANGKIDVPLTFSTGAQIDGSLGDIAGQSYGSLAGHAFWRDPSIGLVGAYAEWQNFDGTGGANLYHASGEGELLESDHVARHCWRRMGQRPVQLR